MPRRKAAGRSAGKRERPRFVAIRQTKLAIACRDAIYNCEARPFGRILRLEWTRMVAWYVRSRALTYEHVLEIAGDIGAELRLRGAVPDPANPVEDMPLRKEFCARLAAAAKANRVPRDKSRYYLDLGIHRYYAARKQSLLDGRCPGCLGDLPCEECGIPAYEIDGAGGLRPVS